MKKFSGFLTVLLGCILVTGTGFALSACQKNEPSPVRDVCLVQVEGGNGGGYYYKDTNCTVTAEVPEGKQFMKWISGDRELSANANYVFTVTEDIRLTAVFADAVEVTDLCTVNVIFGTGSGNYFAGTSHELKVAAEYKYLEFTGWEATYLDETGKEVTQIISTDNPYMLTVTRDMQITAQFDNLKLAIPENAEGQHFRIAANGAYEFDREKNADGSRKTVFVQGVDHLLYRMYDSTDPSAEPVAVFKIVPVANPSVNGAKAYLTDADGSRTQNLKGQLGDLYHDEVTGQAQIRMILGIQTGKTYYFDVQAIAIEGTPYRSSEVSVRGPGFKF